MRMYLMMLPKTLRPSMMPSSSTSRLFSSRTMSADSLATSTAVSTEMPDVRLLQRGRVVDAVAHEPHDVPLALQGLDDLLLLGRGEAGEHGGLLRRLARAARGVEPRELGPGHQVLHVDAHVLAHLARDQVVVPGEDLHRDPGVLAAPSSACAVVSLGGSKKAM